MAPEQGLSKEASHTTNTTEVKSSNDASTSMNNNTKLSKIPVPSPESKQSLTTEAPTRNQTTSRANSPRPAKKVRTSWVSYLNKRELVAYLRENGMDDQGVVDDLRRRLATYINGGYYGPEQLQRFLELEQRHHPTTATTTPEEVDERDPDTIEEAKPQSEDTAFIEHTHQLSVRTSQFLPRLEAVTIEDRTFDRVRAWAIRFHDGDSPIDFVERIEELANSQRVTLDQVPFTLSEVFSGEALAWWRNRRTEWVGWQSFKDAFLKHFLPTNFFNQLEDTVRQRHQLNGEPFRKYAVALESLMRHLQPTVNQRLDRIYRNSLPTVRLLVKRSEFSTLDELTDLVNHIEYTQAESDTSTTYDCMPTRQENHGAEVGPPARPNLRPATRRPAPPLVSSPAPQRAILPVQGEVKYVANPQSVCRQCAEPGHQQKECRRTRVLFCWHCGKVGVRSIHCCPGGVPTTQLRVTQVQEMNRTSIHNQRVCHKLRLNDVTSRPEGIVATIQTNGEAWQAILDTGSWHSFVSPGVAKRLQPQYGVPYHTSTRVIMAGGQHQDVKSGIRTTIDVEGRTHHIRFLIMPMNADTFILGMDALQAIGISMRVGKTTINFRTRSQPDTPARTSKKTTHTAKSTQKQTIIKVKDRLTNAPVLACPDFSKVFKLQADASNHGLGAVLTQDLDGHERVIAYASRQLRGSEGNYSATEKECLAIVWGIGKMRDYLKGYHFVVVADHLASNWLNSIHTPSGKVARWARELQQYDFEVQYRRGKLNVLADALSHQPQTSVNRIGVARPEEQLPWPVIPEVHVEPELPSPNRIHVQIAESTCPQEASQGKGQTSQTPSTHRRPFDANDQTSWPMNLRARIEEARRRPGHRSRFIYIIDGVRYRVMSCDDNVTVKRTSTYTGTLNAASIFQRPRRASSDMYFNAHGESTRTISMPTGAKTRYVFPRPREAQPNRNSAASKTSDPVREQRSTFPKDLPNLDLI